MAGAGQSGTKAGGRGPASVARSLTRGVRSFLRGNLRRFGIERGLRINVLILAVLASAAILLALTLATPGKAPPPGRELAGRQDVVERIRENVINERMRLYKDSVAQELREELLRLFDNDEDAVDNVLLKFETSVQVRANGSSPEAEECAERELNDACAAFVDELFRGEREQILQSAKSAIGRMRRLKEEAEVVIARGLPPERAVKLRAEFDRCVARINALGRERMSALVGNAIIEKTEVEFREKAADLTTHVL